MDPESVKEDNHFEDTVSLDNESFDIDIKDELFDENTEKCENNENKNDYLRIEKGESVGEEASIKHFCHECPYVSESYELLQGHLKIHSCLKCDQCSYTTYNAKHFKKHKEQTSFLAKAWLFNI